MGGGQGGGPGGVLRVREKAESVKCAVMCSLRLFNTASGCVRESLSAAPDG